MRASRWAHVSREMHYRWMRNDPSYPSRFREAESMAAHRLEDEAVRRASEGVSRAVWHKGKIVGYETVCSDSLLMFLLKANNPEKFKERSEVTTVEWDGSLDQLTTPQLERLRDQFRAIAEAGRLKQLEAGAVIDVESAPTGTETEA
jgi:hypothetical protein